MAQAARLSLRMQKELKLLLTDPPPGASFPLLSAVAAASSDEKFSLSSIDAQLEGPEGTVYAKGIFNIKIQIPERYPFQPPIVTFATPIYHPNIDTGGRICLDILNLPPKGAWQPSLNISTVLTSIGLLLSEPNPDDGLMCEASKEYKYNRQAFERKARAMTEKHAAAGVVGNGGSCHIQSGSHPSLINRELKVSDAQANKPSAGCKMSSRGLSLESSSTASETKCERETSDVDNDQTVESCFGNYMEVNKKRKQANGTFDESDLANEKKQVSRRKLSLASSDQVQKTDRCFNESVVTQDANSSSFSVIYGEPKPQENPTNRFGNVCSDINSKKACLVGKKLSLALKGPSLKQERSDNNKENASLANNKENVIPAEKLAFSNSQTAAAKSGTGISHRLSLGPLSQLQANSVDKNWLLMPQEREHEEKLLKNLDERIEVPGDVQKTSLEEALLRETIVVLDSEDSDEEESKGSSRSKLSLARRRIGKLKNKT